MVRGGVSRLSRRGTLVRQWRRDLRQAAEDYARPYGSPGASAYVTAYDSFLAGHAKAEARVQQLVRDICPHDEITMHGFDVINVALGLQAIKRLEAQTSLQQAEEVRRLTEELQQTTLAWATAADDRDEANGLKREAEAKLAALIAAVEQARMQLSADMPSATEETLDAALRAAKET